MTTSGNVVTIRKRIEVVRSGTVWRAFVNPACGPLALEASFTACLVRILMMVRDAFLSGHTVQHQIYSQAVQAAIDIIGGIELKEKLRTPHHLPET